jgi:hypothetical protein
MTRVSYPLFFEEKSTSYLSCNSNNDHASLNINAIFNQKVRMNLFESFSESFSSTIIVQCFWTGEAYAYKYLLKHCPLLYISIFPMLI